MHLVCLRRAPCPLQDRAAFANFCVNVRKVASGNVKNTYFQSLNELSDQSLQKMVMKLTLKQRQAASL